MKKKLFSFLICLALVLPCAFVFTACGKAKPKSMSVKNATTDFFYQDEFSFGEDAVVKIKMSKGDDLEFDAEDITYYADEKVAETDDYKVDYSEYNGNVLGEYEIEVIYKHDKNITYSYKVNVSAKPFADADVTALDYEGVYDGEAHSISLECVVEGATITYSTDGVTYTNTNPTFTEAGEYVVYFTVDKENYAPPVSGTKNVVIERKEVSLVWGNATFTYNKTEQIPTCTIGGIIAGDVCTLTVSGGETDAGNHTATAVSLSNVNYKLPEENTKAFVINPKKVNKPVLASAIEFEYNAGEHALAFEAAFEEGVGAIGTNAATVAGRYTYSVKLASSNYIWNDETTAPMNINWEIKKKAIAVPVVTGEYVYNGVPQAAVITGFNENVMIKTGTDKSLNAGNFMVKFKLKDTSNYYWEGDNISVLAGEKSRGWSIAKATIDAESMDWDYTNPLNYDGTPKTVTLINIPYGFEPIYEGNTKTNAGNYQATVTFYYDAQNYNEITIEPLYWSIAKINPTYTVPTGVEVEKAEGLTLASVSLEGFEGFSWLIPTTAVADSGYYVARYTPADTTNYNVLENVRIYVNVIDNSKGTFTSYVYDGSNAETDKDIAIYVNGGVWAPDTDFGIEVKVGTDFATGSAADATITYNGASSFVVSNAGEYSVEIRVVKEGYNDFISTQTLVVEKAELQIHSYPIVRNEETATTDDTLEVLPLEDGVVTYQGINYVEGVWAWKEPETQLSFGNNEYKVVFIPESQNYAPIEVDVYVYAANGLPIKTFAIGETTYTIPKNKTLYEIDVVIPYGESAIINFTSIKDGFNIYDQDRNDITGEAWFEIVSDDITYSSSVTYVFAQDEYSADLTIILNIVEDYYLDNLGVSYKDDKGDIKKLDLMLYSTGYVQGEVMYIAAEAIEGYTAMLYVNDILVNTIADVELEIGTNKVIVVVKDAQGNAVRYIQKSFNYMLPEVYGLTSQPNYEYTIASVVGNGSNEMIVLNSMETPTITLSTIINTEIYTISAYKMNNANGLYASVDLNTPISISAGVNVFKVILTISGAAKVVKEFVIYDAVDTYGASYDAYIASDNVEDEYVVESNFANGYLGSVKEWNFEYLVNVVEDIRITHIYDQFKTGTITKLINDYYLIYVLSSSEDALYKIVKVNKWYVEDNQTAAKYYLMNGEESSVVEITDLEEVVELRVAYDYIYIKTVNPAAVVSADNGSVYVESGLLVPMVAFDAQDVKITILAGDGETTREVTLKLQVNVIKLLGVTPIKVVDNEEVAGTELVANVIGSMMFGGDISINVSYDSEMPSTAMVADLISNYTIFNQSGEVWTDGDGNKYIKVDIYAPEGAVLAEGFDPDEYELVGVIPSAEGVLLKIEETDGVYFASLWIVSYDTGILYITFTLVDEFVETRVSLSVKDAGGEELQNYDIDLKVVDGQTILGDYFMQQTGLEYSIGSFVGDSTEYFVDVDAYPYEVYTYINGEVGYEVIATIYPSAEGYFLASKEEGYLEGVELGAEFIFQGEDSLCMIYIVEPNTELAGALAALDGENLEVAVDATEGVTVKNMVYDIAKPEYADITGNVNTFTNMGFEALALKLIYNEGEANEFAVIIQVVFASMNDIMGM